MQKTVSNTFAITASKDAVSFDHNDNYSLVEASGNMPAADDARWQYIPVGGQALKPTSAAPYLWHKTITFLTDGSHLDPVISFGGSMGQNGIDYDLVPSVSSILKSENGTLTPSIVSCAIIRRNADGSAQNLSAIPSGYTIRCYRDNVSAVYPLGQQMPTTGVSVISFVLQFNGTDVERHDIRVISEGSQGIDGRGIQSQDYRYKATNSPTIPNVPNDESMWNTWLALADANYSEALPYLWKCIKTTYVDGNGVTDVEYHVEGPTVWGRSGESVFIVDLDNEMTSIPVSSGAGKVETTTTVRFNWKGFYGQTEVTHECTIIPNPNNNWPSGFSCNLANPTSPQVVIAAQSVPANVTDLEFRISHPAYGDRYAKFTVAAVKSGGMGQNAIIYELLPSVTEISVGRDSNGGYSPNPLPYAIACGYVKYDGQALAGSVADLNAPIDGYNIYFRMRQRSNGNWSVYYNYINYKSAYLASGRFNVLTTNKVEFIMCKNTSDVISSESAITSLIDREGVPVVADGVNGTSNYAVDLDNEMGAVACDVNGKVVVGTTFTLRVSAWYGTTDVTAALTFDTIGVGVNGISITNNVATNHELIVSVPTGITLDDVTEIQIPVKHPTYEPNGRTLIFTMAAVRPGSEGRAAVLREMLPSLTQISFARVSGTNTLTPASRTLTVNIRRTEGNTSSEQTISAANAIVCWSDSIMPANKNEGNNISSTACTIPSNTTATNVYLAAFDKTSGALLDKETIPIIKDGEIGSTGNGTDTVSLARMFTMGFEAPGDTDAGWVDETNANYPRENGLSETNRYLWQRKKTTYTLSSNITYEVSLISQYQSGIRANLLEDTAFLDVNEMDGWETHVGEVLPSATTNLAQNGWKNTPDPQTAYTDFLSQKIWGGSSVRKVLPNRWYTLSFYAAQSPRLNLHTGLAFNAVNGVIAGASKQFYLAKGKSATVYVTGRLINAALTYMRINVWTADGDAWLQSAYADIRSTTSTTVAITITNEQSDGRVFNVCPTVYNTDGSIVSSTAQSYRGFCTNIDVDRGGILNTYINRSVWSSDAVQHGTGAVIYVDGIRITAPTTLADGTSVAFDSACSILWKLSAVPTRHTITFKTASWGETADTIHVRFRHSALSHDGWVCMPKLEENTIATEWIENSADRYASDFQHVYVGDWRASAQDNLSTYYLYTLGVRHVVRAPKSATESDMTYYRMKKRTSNSGYCSTQQPYADTDNWERADYLRFVASELILSDEVITDKLTVSKIRGKNNCFVVDGDGNVSAIGGVFSNVNVSGNLYASGLTLGPGSIIVVKGNETKAVVLPQLRDNAVRSIDVWIVDAGDLYLTNDGVDSVLISEYFTSSHNATYSTYLISTPGLYKILGVCYDSSATIWNIIKYDCGYDTSYAGRVLDPNHNHNASLPPGVMSHLEHIEGDYTKVN